jgi:hypothetical protein
MSSSAASHAGLATVEEGHSLNCSPPQGSQHDLNRKQGDHQHEDKDSKDNKKDSKDNKKDSPKDHVDALRAGEIFHVGDTFRVGDTVETAAGRGRLDSGNKGVAGGCGQIHEIIGDSVKILYQHSNEMIQLPMSSVKLMPKRFGGTLTKYSSRGRIVRNWKSRCFEVWSDSVTYRQPDTTTVLGGIILTEQSEIVTDSSLSKRSDRFKGDPPHEFLCGIYDNGHTLWVSSPSEDILNKFKSAIQAAINASAARDPSSIIVGANFGQRMTQSCVIQ